MGIDVKRKLKITDNWN